MRRLFLGYRRWLARHREVTAFPDPVLREGLAGLDREIAGLPGEYAPPGGALFVGVEGGRAAGCAALRRWGGSTAEIKRVYVATGQRGGGLGRRLTQAALRRARALGYRRVVLDTLPTMTAAVQLYRRLGFRPIAPYWDHPVAGALFFEYRFARPSGRPRGRAPIGGARLPPERRRAP